MFLDSFRLRGATKDADEKVTTLYGFSIYCCDTTVVR